MRRREVVFSIITGVLFGFFIVAGKRLDEVLSLDLLDGMFYVQWTFCAILCGVSIAFVWKRMGRRNRGHLSLPQKAEMILQKASGKWAVPILLLLWLPAWLSIFPGVFAYDAYDEWQQICSGQLTAHHPVVHVLFAGGLVEFFGSVFSNYNVGIAACTAIQMILLAMTLSYTIRFLEEQGISVVGRFFALLFYGLSPVVQLFAICTTKDTLYAAAMLLFMISIFRLCKEGEAFWAKRSRVVMFVLSSLGTMIMRNNGKYIVLIMFVVTFIVYKTMWKKMLPYCALVVGLYWVYVGPFYYVLGVQAGGVEEMLSVPLQQIARVYNYEENAFSEEELNYLYELVPQECWESYRSTVSDFVKRGFDEEVFRKDPAKFLRLWAKIGIEHPLTYVNSFLVNTVDFWYPFAVVDGYQDVYEKSSLFDYRVSEPGTEVVYIPWLHDAYESLSHDMDSQRLPGMFLLTSPGWYLAICVFVLMTVWKNRQYKDLMVLCPVILNFLTVLLGPIALVRYVLVLYMIVPIYPTLLRCYPERNEVVE